MRISDWSSDVCSSDLQTGQGNAMTGCGGRTDGYCVHDLCRKHIGVILEKWGLCIVAGLGVADCGQLEILTGLYCGDMLVAGNLPIAGIGRATGRERVSTYV